MIQCKLFISTILIVVTCGGMNKGLEEYDVKMVRDLKDYYQAKWIIIQSCNKPGVDYSYNYIIHIVQF